MRFFFSIVLLILLLSSSVVAHGEPEVSILFFEEDIREALHELMLMTGVNIRYDDTVRGTVTLDLENVPLEQALDMLLISGGFTYVDMGGYYLVGLPDPRSAIYPHLVMSETISLQYLTVTEAQALLPSFYEDYLGFSHSRNSVTITAQRDVIDRFKEDLERIDTAPYQVKVQILITELSREALETLGSEGLNIQWQKGQAFNTEWEALLGLHLGQWELQTNVYGDLLSNIQMLKRDEKASILADPWIQVKDGETAEIFAGEEEILILEPHEGNSRVERIDVGVSLQVTPRVINEDTLQLHIIPCVSHFTEDGNRGLTIRRSEVETTVIAENKETFLLAGITLEKEAERYGGLPWIERIPLLRWVFGSQTREGGERELLIFVTPEIITFEKGSEF